MGDHQNANQSNADWKRRMGIVDPTERAWQHGWNAALLAVAQDVDEKVRMAKAMSGVTELTIVLEDHAKMLRGPRLRK